MAQQNANTLILTCNVWGASPCKQRVRQHDITMSEYVSPDGIGSIFFQKYLSMQLNISIGNQICLLGSIFSVSSSSRGMF